MSVDTAIFAGGCFWCMVQPFDTYPGIEKVESGYTGGHVPNPTYEQVKSGATGHTEAVVLPLIRQSFLTRTWSKSTGSKQTRRTPWDSFRTVVITTGR